jgi:6-phosphogluconolactonase/glucosamine-6-phosphate isomerase/deaminase
VVPVHDSPKAPDDRVSLSIKTLHDASHRLVLTAGAAKAGIIARIRQGEGLPINRIGDINWFVDIGAVQTA